MLYINHTEVPNFSRQVSVKTKFPFVSLQVTYQAKDNYLSQRPLNHVIQIYQTIYSD